jgi:hypothetical protein
MSTSAQRSPRCGRSSGSSGRNRRERGAPVARDGAIWARFRGNAQVTSGNAGIAFALVRGQVGAVAWGGDGEPADKPDSVSGSLAVAARWPSIFAAYLGTSAGPAVPRLALLRVGVAEPPGSPPTLVRSYRTVSPLPVRRTGCPAPRHRRSALCCPVPAGHPVLAHASTRALWSPDFPRRRRSGAAATWPAHRHRAAYRPGGPGPGTRHPGARSAGSAARPAPGGGRCPTRAGRAS